ncbi:MAG: fructosamine kinase family protein [Gammaproteobacteria bacterium]|nr:fructosamine kinase family protein [Gammaproteobacteria bacterium]
MSLWYQVEKAIKECSGQAYKISHQQEVGGGCINSAYQISDGKTKYFVKTNNVALIDMFVAEAAALNEMAATGTVRVPAVICYGTVDKHSFLVLEFLELQASADMTLFAKQLAAMHKISATEFGWHRPNVIGSTKQNNKLTKNWIDFWRTQRLGFQLELAEKNNCGDELLRQGERLSDCLDEFFVAYEPKISMLHGDLWAGNYAALADATPVIFDPALYYGDRETDIAMTTLFGGFNATFYQAYNAVWPLNDGYEQRKELYNVYHIINHYNLFGGGYEDQAVNMMQRLLA